jgi:hypothetical protein
MSQTNNQNNNKPTQVNAGSVNDLQSIMKKIEKDINPKTIQEGLALASNQDALINKLQEGADMFKQQTGRNMTYLEMRYMFG